MLKQCQGYVGRARRSAIDVFRLLKNTRFGNDDNCKHLSSLLSCQELVDQAIKERLSGSNVTHESNCLSGKFFQEENHLVVTKSAMDGISNQIKLAEPHQNSFRQSALKCHALKGRRNNPCASPIHTTFCRKDYENVKSQLQKCTDFNTM